VRDGEDDQSGKKIGSGMNIPDHISESLETILQLFDADPGSF
jgi:hypothetical protein